MNDKKISEKIGQLLYNETPDPDKLTNLLVHINKNVTDMTLWVGKIKSKETGFSLSQEGNQEIVKLTNELWGIYQEVPNSSWNVAHYMLSPEDQSFKIEFENSKELENGKIAFWKYSKKHNS